MSLLTARTAGLAVGALVASGLVLAGSPISPALGDEATDNVTFTDCEVREDPYGANTRIKDNITWTTPVRLNIPTPLRASEEVTIETQLGSLPADIVPVDLTYFNIDSSVEFAVVGRSALGFSLYSINYGDYDASAPLALQEMEISTYWPDAGIYVHRPKSVWFLLKGYVGDTYHEYTFACDQLLDADPLLSTAVYDPSATPTLELDEYAVRQGRTVGIVGAHLLGSAPTTPAAQATVTIGGLVVGSYPIDESGAIDVRVTVPPFAPPGSVQVRVDNGPRRASTPLTVVALKGKITASPKKVATGKAITLRGSSFKPGETVKLTLKGGRGAGKKSFSTKAKAGADGTFTKAVKLKKAAKGSWKVSAAGSASKRSGRTSFKVR